MPRVTVDLDVMEAFIEELNELGANTKGIAKQAMYRGAKICADELRKAVDGLERVPDVYLANAAKNSGPISTRGPDYSGERTRARIAMKLGRGAGANALPLTVKQKNGLRNGLGISKFRSGADKISTVVGFAGYNTLTSRRWPNGQPNIMIAAACEHGASYMKRQPFIEPTYSATKDQIGAEMRDYIIARYKEILKDS